MKLFNRNTLFGLGLGLLVAVVFLGAGGGLRKKTSDVEIVARARRLGMSFPTDRRVDSAAPLESVVPPSSAPSPTSPDGGVSVSPDVQAGPGARGLVSAAKKPRVKTTPTRQANVAATKKRTKAAAGVEKRAPAAKPTTTVKTGRKSQPTVLVTIPRGATLQDVARLMLKAELIGDANEFIRRLQVDRAGNRIVAGRYRIATNINVHQLIGRILVGPARNE